MSWINKLGQSISDRDRTRIETSNRQLKQPQDGICCAFFYDGTELKRCSQAVLGSRGCDRHKAGDHWQNITDIVVSLLLIGALKEDDEPYQMREILNHCQQSLEDHQYNQQLMARQQELYQEYLNHKEKY